MLLRAEWRERLSGSGNVTHRREKKGIAESRIRLYRYKQRY